MNKWKWIKTGLVTFLSLGIVTTSLVILAWNVDKPTTISTYSLEFLKNKNMTEQEIDVINQKNKFIKDLRTEANNIITNYKNEKNSNENLNFNFANLTNNQTQGEINFYNSLDRSLKEISPNLGIINNPRTPKLINEAFYNKNTEMMTFYWSPDYNSVGTWLKYMFTDIYTMPNMWPPTYSILKRINNLNNQKNDLINEQNASGNNQQYKDQLQIKINELQAKIDQLKTYYPWCESLANYISTKNIPGKRDEKLFKSPIEILEFIASSRNYNGPKMQIDDYYVALANVIGTWVSENSNISMKKEVDENNNSIFTYGEIPPGIAFVNWIASQNPNIPYQEVGNNSSSPYVLSTGLFLPSNPNADINFRDWYYYSGEFNDRVAKDWWPGDPFQSNETAWNGPFSKAPNSLYAQSVWTSLTSWTCIGDENDNIYPENHEIRNDNIKLVANGIKNDITKQNELDSLKNELASKKTLSFRIRPIPWVDYTGKSTGNYLSPADFWAGFKAFKRSIDNGINANNAYFIGLAGVDFEKTLNDPKNKEFNLGPNDQKIFKVYFNDPILSITDILDIFQKQYFMALPYKNVKVQNIVDDEKYKKIAVGDKDNPNILDVSKTKMSEFYGVGVGYDKEVWSNLWSAAPYYISNVDKQSITYKLNNEYFKSFSDVTNNVSSTSLNYYQSFMLENKVNNKTIKKLSEINIKYAGSYNLDILYEQFKAGELNKALLQSINLMDALTNNKKSLKYQKVKKINKSNTIGFNLQIYERWNEPLDQVPSGYMPAQNIILDQNNQPMWDKKNRRPEYTIDEFGNYVWPAGKKPKLKSNVSQIYQDLIVSDFYTPIQAKGKSATIRFAINNTINWVSLKSLVTPGVSASVQYSFMPYGVYELYNPISSTGNQEHLKSNYWDLSANKRYLTENDLNNFNESLIFKRMSGNMIWTYNELLNNMIKV